MWFNPIISFLLRSPLDFLLGDTMLISVTGRKSGKSYTTPVGYYRDGDCLWILSNRDRTWWRNVREDAPVTLRMKGKEITGVAETMLDEANVATQLKEYIRHIPVSAKAMHVQMKNGKANDSDVKRLARIKMFVNVKLHQI